MQEPTCNSVVTGEEQFLSKIGHCEDHSLNLIMAAVDHESSEDDDNPRITQMKKHVKALSGSDSEVDKLCDYNSHNQATTIQDQAMNATSLYKDSDSDSDIDVFKSIKQKSRIKFISRNDSDSDSSELLEKSMKNEEQQIRMKNKRNKMNQKFKSLITSRAKDSEPALNCIEENHKSSESQNSNTSDHSDTGITSVTSIKKIKKKIKERIRSIKPSICDPDTSDDDDARETQAVSTERKRTKLTSPKAARMSAKQAMENMQKIKSESNRMLREQQVSLPYHRPRALLLKDFMNRRKPAVAADGRALPIKMNDTQLKQYVLQLEQRQKEVIELCKSESEEDELQDTDKASDLLYDTLHTDTMESITNIIEPVELNNVPNCVTHEDARTILEDVYVDKVSERNGNVSEPLDLLSKDKLGTKVFEEQATDASMQLVYSNSEEIVVNAQDKDDPITNDNTVININKNLEHHHSACSAQDSQCISLHLDTDKTDTEVIQIDKMVELKTNNVKDIEMDIVDNDQSNEFSDDDIHMENIDLIIENAVLLNEHVDNVNSPMLIRDITPLNGKPRLTGAPGMVIDLDGMDPIIPKKLTGVELLKERFTYFAKLKTAEEMDREKEKRIKPGTQHLKLRQELEEKIAEQRSLEWAKRLEEEKQQHMELKALRGDDSDVEDDIDKIEAKLEQDADVRMNKESEEEEDDGVGEKPEKPRVRNPMIADEAEESDCDQFENLDDGEQAEGDIEDNDEENQEGEDEEKEDSEESSDDETSESEIETSKPKKGRILKAFEDSDDEDASVKANEAVIVDKSPENTATTEHQAMSEKINMEIQIIKDSQDDVIQLAQRSVSSCDDLFRSQDSAAIGYNKLVDNDNDNKDLGTQSFSILNTGTAKQNEIEIQEFEKLSATTVTQTLDDNLDMVRPGEFTQNIMGSQLPIDQSSQSQPLGDDVLALCTGKFYDNQFVSLANENVDSTFSQDSIVDGDNYMNYSEETDNALREENVEEGRQKEETSREDGETEVNVGTTEDENILKSILDELHDPECDPAKPNKCFIGNNNEVNDENSQFKKKFTIDSEDDSNDADDVSARKKKKIKKKKVEQRALQISDDEEEELEEQDDDNDEFRSDLDEDNDGRIVEYDSEENEVVLSAPKSKKKRKATDFFENEAELTSEDEWMGSGDEDEAGLDRMEREAGDDETFNQGKLQTELGQIHLRDVLDQDKREVRIIQELLFEDGDLGAGHRQRKFRWRNADGEEETGTVPDELADTQEEDFESEEQWRKQRHEREVFLREMKKQDDVEDSRNVSLNRTTIIKANLMSKTMSTLLMEVNTSKTESPQEKKVALERNTAKEIPSPKKGFPIFKQNYHGSLLTRGRGALARLAALATPLATDDDAPQHGSMGTARRNFVFTALTPEQKEPKVIKRKADSNVNTPRLVKKMKTEDKNKNSKSSLLDQMKL